MRTCFSHMTTKLTSDWPQWMLYAYILCLCIIVDQSQKSISINPDVLIADIYRYILACHFKTSLYVMIIMWDFEFCIVLCTLFCIFIVSVQIYFQRGWKLVWKCWSEAHSFTWSCVLFVQKVCSLSLLSDIIVAKDDLWIFNKQKRME